MRAAFNFLATVRLTKICFIFIYIIFNYLANDVLMGTLVRLFEDMKKGDEPVIVPTDILVNLPYFHLRICLLLFFNTEVLCIIDITYFFFAKHQTLSIS